MKKSLFLVTSLLSIYSAYSQSSMDQGYWSLGGMNSDMGYTVIQMSDSGYVFAGYTWSYGSGLTDCLVVKTDVNGNLLWSKVIGGPSYENARSIRETYGKTLLISGTTDSYGAGGSDLYLVKLDSMGNIVSGRTVGTSDVEGGGTAIPTNDGGYMVCGYTNHLGLYNAGYIAKLDWMEAMDWNLIIASSQHNYINDIQQTSSGKYIAVGSLDSSASDADLLVMQLDAGGNVLWSKTIGGTVGDYANSVILTSDGNYMIAGTTASYGAGQSDVLLIKMDSTGTIVWSKTWGTAFDETAVSVVQTPEGGYAVAGTTSNNGGKAYITKFDVLGNFEWSAIPDGGYFDEGWDLAVTLDNGFVMTGRTTLFDGSADMSMFKMDQYGNTCYNVFSVTAPSVSVTPTMQPANLTFSSGGNASGVGSNSMQVGTLRDVCATTQITSVELKDFQVFPNPAFSDEIFVQVQSGNSGLISITITDVLNKQLSAISFPVSEGNSSFPVYTGNLTPGVYFIQLGYQNKTLTKKFIKG